MSDNPSFEFVDTNILVYAHDRSSGEKNHKAQDLIRRLWDLRLGCISIQVLQEFYVTVTKKVALPLKPDQAAQVVSNLCYWRVYTPAGRDVLGAIDLGSRFQISFWDAMLVYTAVQSGCKVIWSEDLNQGQVYDNIQVRNPFLDQ
jgi:predicted nucleic acid-binding protein